MRNEEPMTIIIKEFNNGKLIYAMNMKEKTASIIGHQKINQEITIPRSFEHESQEYIITSIYSNAFRFTNTIQSVKFTQDSQLKTIEKEAFYGSSITSIILPPHLTKIGEGAFSSCFSLQHVEIPEHSELQTVEKNAFSGTIIESISFPPSLIELKAGWCHNHYLNKISVHKNNPKYICYNDQFIIEKSDDTGKFDSLVFSVKNIKTAIIPIFIKQISPYAFNSCRLLQKVEFLENSQIQAIKENAFSDSSIEEIAFPTNVKYIEEYAFNYCGKLQKALFPINSKLQLIDRYAFINSNIRSIFIPANVKTIGECAFKVLNFQIIEFDENSELSTLNANVFDKNSNLIVMVPYKLSYSLNFK